MIPFDVRVDFPFPLVGSETVRVEANTHAHATLLCRGMRARKGWHRDSTYTPRMADRTSYSPPAALVVLEHPEALGSWS